MTGALMNDKIMFGRLYCINSAKHCENEENIGALYFITSDFPTRISYARFGPRSLLIIKHLLCVMPGNEHNKKPYINSNTLCALKFPD